MAAFDLLDELKRLRGVQYARIAVWVNISSFRTGAPRQQAFAQAQATANTALALDHRTVADAALLALIAKPPTDQMYSSIATMYALRKDADQTFAWLDHAVNNDEDVGANLLSDPFLPLFGALVHQLWLPVPGEKLPAATAAPTAKDST